MRVDTEMDRPIRIALLLGNPCIRDGRVLKEAEALAGAGHCVAVFCTKGEDAPDEEQVNGVSYFRYSTPQHVSGGSRPQITPHQTTSNWPSRFIRSARSFMRPIRVTCMSGGRYEQLTSALHSHVVQWKPDVLHANDLETMPCAMKVVELSSHPVSTVYDSHEFASEQQRTGIAVADWLMQRKEHAAIRFADRMITVSESFADVYSERFGIRKPTVIFNSPRISKPSKLDRQTVRSACHLSTETPLAVYTGHLNSRRGLKQLMIAFSQLPWLHLAIVGSRRTEVDATVTAMPQAEELRQRLHILDGVHPDEVVHYIRDADLALVPRIRKSIQQEYSLPNKLFEAAFASLPIVSGDTEEQKAFVCRYQIGLTMDSTSPDSITRTIESVYAQRDSLRPQREVMTEMESEYGWPCQEDKLLALYSEIADNMRSVNRVA